MNNVLIVLKEIVGMLENLIDSIEDEGREDDGTLEDFFENK